MAAAGAFGLPQEANLNPTLDPADFEQLIENLCAAAAADFAATRSRLERLRRVGPEGDRSAD